MLQCSFCQPFQFVSGHGSPLLVLPSLFLFYARGLDSGSRSSVIREKERPTARKFQSNKPYWLSRLSYPPLYISLISCQLLGHCKSKNEESFRPVFQSSKVYLPGRFEDWNHSPSPCRQDMLVFEYLAGKRSTAT